MFIVLPWSLNNSSDELNAQEITDDLSFYQINTCEFSLIEVLIENLKLHIRNTLNLDLIITPRIDVLERLLGLTELEILFIAIGQHTCWIDFKIFGIITLLFLIKTHESHIKFLSKNITLSSFHH